MPWQDPGKVLLVSYTQETRLLSVHLVVDVLTRVLHLAKESCTQEVRGTDHVRHLSLPSLSTTARASLPTTSGMDLSPAHASCISEDAALTRSKDIAANNLEWETRKTYVTSGAVLIADGYQ